MKSFISLFFSLFFCIVSYAQRVGNTDCYNPFACDNDLRKTYYQSSDIKTSTYSYANPKGEPSTFHDVNYTADEGGSPCTKTKSCTGSTSQLVYEVYYPSPAAHNYSTCKLPVLVLFHGGSFQDCAGSYDKFDIVQLCNSVAMRGVIAISVEYRTGIMDIPDEQGSYYSAQQLLGMWRAGQDGRGALRSVIARELEAKEPYRIDTSRIFIGGNSAGSVIAMNIAFYNKTSLLDDVFTGISANNILGSINQDYYYGSPSINYTIKGVVDMWGAVFVPPAFLNSPENFFFVPGNKMPPVVAFHGGLDSIFNYRYADLRYPPSRTPRFNSFTSESYCLNSTSSVYKVSSSRSGPNGYVLGSQNIYEMMKREKVPAEFYLDCDMGHGFEYNCDFGLTNPDQEELFDYVVQRTLTFFQAVVSNTAMKLNTTKFVNCENFRNKCKSSDNNKCTGVQDCSFPLLVSAPANNNTNKVVKDNNLISASSKNTFK